MIRTMVRATAEVLATAAGLTAFARRRRRDTIAVLAYHNVVRPRDAGRGDASLHLPLDRFIDQIDRLSRTHDIIDIEDAAGPPSMGRPRAIITFDDAYHGAVTLALPEIARRGLPAVVFVAPGLLNSASTWWDELAQAGLLSDAMREDALTSLAGRADAVRSRTFPAGSPLPSLPESYGIASLEELRGHCSGSIRVASHTWAHEYLPALDADALNATLARTLEWLDRHDGPTSRWLALPYGGGSSEIGRAAMQLGHTGVLRISGGLWDRKTPRAQVPRINIPAGVSLRGFEVRTSGMRR